VRVVPVLTLAVEPALAVVATNAAGQRRDTAALRLSVRVAAPGASAVEGMLRPSLPTGWRAEPAATPLRLAAGEQRVLEVRVQPPARAAAGDYQVGAAFESAGGARYDRGFALVDYPHVAPRALYRPATAKAAAFDVTVPAGLRIGYVGGAGDDVPDALARLGLAAEPLDAAALASADLSRYDVIVTGIRAYEVRPDLVQHNARLLDYVRRGGTLIVQYNKYEYTAPGIAPYPLSIARPHDRVTDETAAVRVLDPAHAVFNRPNRITAADFDGWIQERGLYFPREWDARYTPLLEMADPGEPPLQGALLVAKYGEGTYVYTGLAFFRQLPAGVPGAYRLFANLLALGAGR
jgi:hypothetical protein